MVNSIPKTQAVPNISETAPATEQAQRPGSPAPASDRVTLSEAAQEAVDGAHPGSESALQIHRAMSPTETLRVARRVKLDALMPPTSALNMRVAAVASYAEANAKAQMADSVDGDVAQPGASDPSAPNQRAAQAYQAVSKITS